jgi:pimeloyl-ACP methyl ester carboxylesterase
VRINKVTLKAISIFAVLAIVAIPLSNLIIKSADPFKPSSQKIDSSALVNYYKQGINWQDCYGGFKCATYKVPRDYSNLDAGEFDIAVMKHVAPGAIGNLVVNPGGPGGSGVDYAYSYESAFTEAVIESFNIVGFDPRGVGRSSAIDCLTNAETDAAYASNSYPDNEAELAQMQAESKEFADKCKSENDALQLYSTANAARDMDILRELLGDQKLNYLGKSYGTYLGSLYAKLFPDKVGRFVLDGAVDPTINSAEQTLQQAVGFDSAFNAFAADCVKQSSCVLNSDASNQIQSKLAEIRKNPMAVGDRKLTESLAVYGIAFGLYDKEFGWPELRGALKDLFNGDGKSLLSMADTYNRRDAKGNYDSNDASSLAVIACDDFPPSGSDVSAIKSAAPIFGKYVAYSEIDCEYLPKPKYELINSRINLQSPVLVIGTSNDPATPYQWAVKLASLLTNSVLISVSGEGHTGYNRDTPCVDQAVEKYLISGVIPAQNLACSA